MCVWPLSGEQCVMTFGDRMRFVSHADNLDFKYQVSQTVMFMYKQVAMGTTSYSGANH